MSSSLPDHPPIPVPPSDRHRIHNRNGPVVVHHRGRVVVWGGDPNGVYENFDYSDREAGWGPEDVYYLDTSNHTWHYQKTTGDLPRHTCYAAAQVVGNRLYVIGGSISRAELNDFGVSAPEDETFSAVIERAQLYSNNVHFLDLNSWRWTKLEPASRKKKPRKSCKMSSWLTGDSIFIFGGTGESEEPIWGIHNDFAAFDTVKNEWWWPLCSGQEPPQRTNHASFVDVRSNRAYVFGGWVEDVERDVNNWDGGGPANDLYTLDMTTWKWEELMRGTRDDEDSTVPRRRKGHTVTLLPPMLRRQSSSKDGVTTALLYGGTGVPADAVVYASMSDSLGDCWMLHLDATSSSSSVPNYHWVRCAHLEKGPRSLHGAVAVPETGQLFLVGGCLNRNTWSWAKRALKVPVAPPSLKELAVVTLVGEKERRVGSEIRRSGPLSFQTLFDEFQKLQLEEEEDREEEDAVVEKLRSGELGVYEY